jgi:hypothetical protein
VLEEVTARGFGSLHTLDSCIGVNIEGTGGKNVIDILGSLSDIALNIHGETRRFGYSESEIQGNAAGNTAETDEYTPAVVDMFKVGEGIMNNLVLECADDDEGDEGGSCIDFRRQGTARVGTNEGNEPKLPQPWKAKTAVMRRPRVLVAANSDEMTALRG